MKDKFQQFLTILVCLLVLTSPLSVGGLIWGDTWQAWAVIMSVIILSLLMTILANE